MRYEPANAKFFETEVRWKSLCAALKLLGCFDPTKTQFEPRTNVDFVKRGFDVFEKFFCALDDDDSILNQTSEPLTTTTTASATSPDKSPYLPSANIPQTTPTDSPVDSPMSPSKAANNSLIYNQMDEKLIFTCYIMRFLYDTALDVFDKYFYLFI